LDNRQRTAARLARHFVALRRLSRDVHQIGVTEVTTLRPLTRAAFFLILSSGDLCDPETRQSPLSLSRPRTHQRNSRDRDSASTGSELAGAGKCHGSRVAARLARARAQNWPSTFPRTQVKFPSIKQQFPRAFSRELSQEAAGTRAFLAHASRQNRPEIQFCPVNSRQLNRDRFAESALG